MGERHRLRWNEGVASRGLPALARRLTAGLVCLVVATVGSATVSVTEAEA